MKKLIVALMTMGCLHLGHAQQSKIYTDNLATYNQALDLYQEDQYITAQRLFQQVREQSSDETIKGNAAYYAANCAVRLNQRNANDQVEEFVEEFPTSTKRNSAYIDVADYYFENGNYRQAALYYEKVDESTLSRKQKNKYAFNTGYTLVQSKKFDEAKPYLNRVSDDPEYGWQAKYYLGYIAYEGDDLEQAEELFNEVEEAPETDAKLSYYQADLNYKLGRFDEAIRLAQEQLPKSNRQEQSQLNRIIGQSLFNKGDYAAALPYLQEYRGTRGKWNNNDYYQLGYTYYKLDDFENAVATFNKIIDGENATAQNAYYHLGQSYIKLDRSEDALNAFKRASELDYDDQITEDALYNYAKLSYENGNPYDSVPAVILDYVENYPDAGNMAEMNELLIDSYFTSKNYAEALELMEDGRIKGNENVYGKVALYNGLNLFTAGNYQEAIDNLDKSIKYLKQKDLLKKARFWKAESFYQLNNYRDALDAFNAAQKINASIGEDDLLNYDLGYTHFKLKNYSQSISSFERFATGNGDDAVRVNDAYMRIGDANFVSKQYWPAMEAYNKAIQGGATRSDYASFQKALSYGFVNRADSKIETLNDFLNNYPSSPYRDDVLYELGNTYINNDRVANGLSTYDRLIQEFPNSSYTSQAMMRKGLQLYNDGNLNEALTVFKSVASRYPGTPQAVEAVSSARLVYIDQGRTDEYASWVRSLDFIDVTDSELDDTAYESAEQAFLQGKNSAAIRGFNSYLKQFPNGKYALQAHFNLAQAYFTAGDKQTSIPHYQYVAQRDQSEYLEPSLARLGEILLNDAVSSGADRGSAYAKAIPILIKLESIADFPQNVDYARSNLMKAYYETGQFNKAINYANKVLSNAGTDDAVKADAYVIIARSAFKENDMDRARSAYQDVLRTASGALAAEATFYKGFFENRAGDHEKAINTIQGLSKNYGSYKLWSARGLVVMAQSYDATGQTLNAVTLLQGVIDNFPQYPDVVSNARQELNRIKAVQSKTNSSIAPSNN
ncbi:tetratricopeptide repeat protein [Nonlabens ponticola]|uniref:Tetratricopeptide repeat protein n=1 Tax=Nonlabens ponticola TaxID=2496866 RepID=A0A3S9MX14_9FLAO|nr:tetratricopeptide repeat protein [Nonlabens ponticola]AZQ43687.1 tetratricopeptide repeat protein [Nonlabens ponticola]